MTVDFRYQAGRAAASYYLVDFGHSENHLLLHPDLVGSTADLNRGSCLIALGLVWLMVDLASCHSLVFRWTVFRWKVAQLKENQSMAAL